MMKCYTPKEWYSLFDCPSLIIDDEGKIWSADSYYSIISGEPSGRIDYVGEKIYGKDLGYGMFSEPIAYMQTKNGITEIYDAEKGFYSSPILYIQNDQLYTPDQWMGFGSPGGYIKKDTPSSSEYTDSSSSDSYSDYGSSSGRYYRSSGTSTGGGLLIGVLAILLIPFLIVFFFHATPIALVLASVYLGYAIILLIRHGAVINSKTVLKGIAYGFATLVVVYLVLYIITTFSNGYDSAAIRALSGKNELAGWIAGAGTLLLQFDKAEQK